MAVIQSAHAHNGGPVIARPEPLTTRRMLKRLKKRLDDVAKSRIRKRTAGMREIHKLRVATRKSLAALAVCEPLLKKSFVRRIEKSLEAQRKALGVVRDWDVLITKLLCTPADEKAELRCDVLLHLAQQRREACLAAVKELKSAQRDSNYFAESKANRKLAKRSKGIAKTAHQLFRSALKEPLETIRGSDSISGDAEQVDMDSLHALRIACKGLRYLLEYREEVSSAHPAPQALELLTEFQQRLGDLHDWAARPELLKSAEKADSKPVRRWIEETSNQAQTRLPAEIARYLNWRKSVQIESVLQACER